MQKFILEKYGQYFQIHIIEECGINGSILASVSDCYHRVRGYGNGLHLPAHERCFSIPFSIHFYSPTRICCKI